jgi:hypothetical protein
MTTHDDVRSTMLLRELVSILLRNYPDTQWDASTRDCLAAANDHLGAEPIVWNLASTDEEKHDATGQ